MKFRFPIPALARALCCFALLLAMLAAPAYAAKENPDSLSVNKSITEALPITLGKAEVYKLDRPIADVLVADPKVADVIALQADKLFIVGATLGDTNLVIMDPEGNVVKKLNVHVRIDEVAIQNMLRNLFPNENDIQVKPLGQQIMLTGEVSNPATAKKVANVVAAHLADLQRGGNASARTNDIVQNLLEVRGEQQVTLRVRIVEMSRSVIRELGVSTSINDPDVGPVNSGDPTLGTTINPIAGFAAQPLLTGNLVLDTGITGIGFIEFLIDALEEDNLANVLAEPNLTALSGEEAGFLAGGEFPVPVGRDNQGNIILEFREFGVSLNFKPLVMSEDRISLQMNTEVSSLDFEQGITLEDTEVPGLDVRRATTTVELGSGSSLMIAGLLQSEALKGMAGLPGIKNTPVLGDLVSSRRFNRAETELVILVTPYLVTPYADKTQAKAVNIARPNAMAQAFINNMRKKYGDRADNLPPATESFGYMME